MSFTESFTPVACKVTVSEGVAELAPLFDSGVNLLSDVLSDPTKFAWHSNGNRYDPSGMKKEVYGCFISCGGQAGEYREGNTISTRYYGATELYLSFDEQTPSSDRFRFRDMLFFGSPLVVQGDSSPTRVILASSISCKECGGKLMGAGSLEWRICTNCIEVCAHEYKEGVTHGPGGLAYSPFCKKCGRGDPNWTSSGDPMFEAVNVVEKGGLDVLFLQHEDGTATVISKK